MKNIKKADLKLFLSKTDRILIEAKFMRTVVSDHAGNYEWIKNTKYGFLYIDPDNDSDSKVFSIFGRFEDTLKAKDVLLMFNGNTYSGKCNIHTSELSEALRQFEHLLKAVA